MILEIFNTRDKISLIVEDFVVNSEFPHPLDELQNNKAVSCSRGGSRDARSIKNNLIMDSFKVYYIHDDAVEWELIHY